MAQVRSMVISSAINLVSLVNEASFVPFQNIAKGVFHASYWLSRVISPNGLGEITQEALNSTHLLVARHWRTRKQQSVSNPAIGCVILPTTGRYDPTLSLDCNGYEQLRQ